MNDSIRIEVSDPIPTPAGARPQGRLSTWLSACAVGLSLVACGGDGGVADPQGGVTGGGVAGASSIKPGASSKLFGGAFILDSNLQGTAQGLQLVEMRWGRLVDILDTGPDGEARTVYRDMVIDESIDDAVDFGGGQKWDLRTNPITGRQALQIFTDSIAEPDLFDLLVQETTLGLKPIDPKGTSTAELPPFTVVPRNCALSLRFNDLLDESTIELNDTIRVLVGAPATVPFDARVFGDPNHGGVAADDGQFHSSRLIVDFTVSEFDLATIDEVVQVNGIGLPASEGTVVPNVLIRMPTREAPTIGQFDLLRNVRGNELEPDLNEPLEFTSPTLDVVRAMRAGNSGEPNNGFLVDQERPRVLGVQPVTLVSATEEVETDPDLVDDPRDFRVAFSFAVSGCATNPVEGDVLQLAGGLRFEVLEDGQTVGQNASNVLVRVPVGGEPEEVSAIEDPVAQDAALQAFVTGLSFESAQLLNVFRVTPGGQPISPPGCFVRFSPSAASLPTDSVDPTASILIRFSEPLDPASVRPFDTLYVARSSTIDATQTEGETAPEPADLVPAVVVPTPDFTEFRFLPSVEFNHSEGFSEAYFLSMVSDLDEGIVDLAGNGLTATLPRIEFRLDAEAETTATGGWVLRFNSTNEDGNIGPEVRGQIVFDTINGRIGPRPVQRFAAVLDRTQPLVGDMQQITTGLQTPLASLGSRAHLTWRYTDVGYGISQIDGTFYDLDVEGLSLSPLGGQVTATFYDEFEMNVGHGARVPDESINPGNFNPDHPNSGFRPGGTFAQSFLPDPTAGPFLVHPRASGFSVSNSDVFLTSSGTPMLPMPWNRGLSEDQKRFFTWRDTAVTTLGALNDDGSLIGTGVPLEQEVAVLGLGNPPGSAYGFGGVSGANGVPFPSGVPTIGLPLISEFRCYPTEEPSLNNFDVSIAISSCNRPFFRAFSTGGVNSSGQAVEKDPDQEVSPSGGFNGNPQIAPVGQTTNGRDPTVYLGQLDVVLRISRAHTTLIDAEQSYGVPGINKLFDYAPPVVEPSPALQPLGTGVVLAWRGSDGDPALLGEDVTDASKLDVYGNVAYGLLSGQTNNPTDARVWPFTQPEWSNSIDSVDGLRYIQTRFTFVSNTASQLSPVVDSYAVAFRN